MKHASLPALFFVMAALTSSACSGSGGSPADPIFATATPATAAPSPAATASPATVPSAAVTLTPAQVPAPQFTGNGEFDFDQTTPLVVTAPQTSPNLHPPYVTERFYTGTFALAGCTTQSPGATCGVQTEGGDQVATCSLGATTLGLSLETDAGLYDDALTGPATPLTCAVTFADAYGHSTDVTLTDDAPLPTATPFPAATGDGNFSFSQPSPVTVSFASSPLPIVVSEGHYSGPFTVIGCQFPNQYQCSDIAQDETIEQCSDPGTQSGNVGSDATLATGTASNFSDVFFAAGSVPLGAPVFSCSYVIGDRFGHSTPFVVRVLPASLSSDGESAKSPGATRPARSR